MKSWIGDNKVVTNEPLIENIFTSIEQPLQQLDKGLIKLFRRLKVVLRIELLSFLTFEQIAKTALLSREMYRLLDPNRIFITTNKLHVKYKNEN